ncbi:hypothetical protein J7E50_10055 [Pedobacter sp. ISL-68]|uniref:hypothetical protein n=1 Tax=unclassified Pedobacter TaxID=2628915 RepID=UPI001BE784CC|nr:MULTISPECIES: hypothetical protein [unclassified Pedobacter]MBT2561173.1 hypothetical protein [Pedobacter sp. ISL-64]MBT2590562.1 hypothetical protein [Pedobacter sp. ISL-68]
MRTSDLTSKMLAYRYLKDFDIDQSIDWAVEMLSLGYETPSLMILAGISKPANFFEAEKHLLSSFNELVIVLPEKHEAIVGYCRTFIEKMAKAIDVKSNLKALYSTGLAFDYEKPIFDFYLLYWAWCDLDYGEAYQHYVPEATKDNIKEFVTKKAIGWLQDNRYV